MKSILAVFLLVISLSCLAAIADGQRRFPINSNSYYEFLMRAQHGSNSKDPIVSSRSPKLDRNCFFSPVQCMFDTLPIGNLNSFRR